MSKNKNETLTNMADADILQQLSSIIRKYGEASERNESDYSIEVKELIKRAGVLPVASTSTSATMSKTSTTSGKGNVTGDVKRNAKGKEALATAIIKKLKGIPDAGAELFPFELIEELGDAYNIDTDFLTPDEPVNNLRRLKEILRSSKINNIKPTSNIDQH